MTEYRSSRIFRKERTEAGCYLLCIVSELLLPKICYPISAVKMSSVTRILIASVKKYPQDL